MSIYKRIRNKLSIEAGPNPVEIEQRLEAIRTELASLETAHGTASFNWATGEVPDAAEVERLDAAIMASRRNERALVAALALATEEASRLERERLEGIRKVQINAVAQHARASERAATDFSAALEVVVTQYRAMIEARGKMRAACPVGSVWPGLNARCAEIEVRRMVAQELARVSWNDADLRGAEATGVFPGASKEGAVADGLNPLASPTTYPPLPDRLRSTDDWLLDHFKNEFKPEPVNDAVNDPAPDGKPLTAAEIFALENQPVKKLA